MTLTEDDNLELSPDQRSIREQVAQQLRLIHDRPSKAAIPSLPNNHRYEVKVLVLKPVEETLIVIAGTFESAIAYARGRPGVIDVQHIRKESHD